MIEYTIGVVFNWDLNMVLLIQKNNPDWQRGKFNFPGGKMKFNKLGPLLETPQECIERELFEESELIIVEQDWIYCGVIVNNDKNTPYKVHLLTYRYTHNDLPKTIQNTPEPTGWFPITSIPSNRISNLLWLMYFAKNIHEQGNHAVLVFGTFESKFPDGTTKPISSTSGE